jgi:hypothetical protein
MLLKSFILWLLSLTLIIQGGAHTVLSQQNQEKGFVFDSPAGENTVVRFFYNPPGDAFHAPLVFRALKQGDARLDTGPMSTEGHIDYVSLLEMQQLLQELAQSNLAWQESEKIETLGSFKQLQITDSMEILVVTSKGTAKAQVRPARICETLGPLDSALTTKRSLWEFQAFRIGYGCKILGFKYGAYPDQI